MSRRKWVPFASLITVGVILISPATFASFGQVEVVTLADDAYHYRSFADGHHDGNYIEWWYFNVYDADQDLEAIFTYFTADPENQSAHGLAQVAAVAYTPGGILSSVDVYPAEFLSASYDRADVSIGNSVIEVLDQETYHISGVSRDGRLSWDLLYAQQAGAWFAAEQMKVGRLPWERMSWLIYMPRAQVNGQVVVDGQVVVIDAPGYHDHNWGEWIFTDALWNWAQYSEPGLAFEMGDFINRPVGVASIEAQGQRAVFSKNQYKLTHTRWTFDELNRSRYPVETVLVAENETHRVTLSLQAIETHPLRGDLPFPLPDAIIYEQTAYFQGELWVRNVDGEWVSSALFDGYGFKEYTARRF